MVEVQKIIGRWLECEGVVSGQEETTQIAKSDAIPRFLEQGMQCRYLLLDALRCLLVADVLRSHERGGQ